MQFCFSRRIQALPIIFGKLVESWPLYLGELETQQFSKETPKFLNSFSEDCLENDSEYCLGGQLHENRFSPVKFSSFLLAELSCTELGVCGRLHHSPCWLHSSVWHSFRYISLFLRILVQNEWHARIRNRHSSS